VVAFQAIVRSWCVLSLVAWEVVRMSSYGPCHQGAHHQICSEKRHLVESLMHAHSYSIGDHSCVHLERYNLPCSVKRWPKFKRTLIRERSVRKVYRRGSVREVAGVVLCSIEDLYGPK
jgi:hypothetical protein